LWLGLLKCQTNLGGRETVMAEKKPLTWVERYEEGLVRLKAMKLEAEIDCNFDVTKMDSNFNVTMAIQKWHGKRIDWSNTFRVIESKHAQITRARYEFYKKEFHLKLDNKLEMELFVHSDKEYIEVDNMLKLTKDVLQFIKDTVENLKGKGFEMKRWLDWQNFINGR